MVEDLSDLQQVLTPTIIFQYKVFKILSTFPDFFTLLCPLWQMFTFV